MKFARLRFTSGWGASLLLLFFSCGSGDESSPERSLMQSLVDTATQGIEATADSMSALATGMSVLPAAASSETVWASGTSAPTSMSGHTATLLEDSETVLVVGGWNSIDMKRSGVWAYNYTNHTWGELQNLNERRTGHTSTLLRDGTVLVVGGHNGCLEGRCSYLSSAELYDPDRNQWLSAGSMSITRSGHSAILLPDAKRVLVIGGMEQPTQSGRPEIYNVDTRTWTLARDRMRPYDTVGGAILLSTGKVLVLSSGTGAADLYDPVSDTWAPGEAMKDPCSGFTLTRLNDDTIMVVGQCTAQRYDPRSGRWTAAGNTGPQIQGDHTASLLGDGRVLITGGFPSGSSLYPDSTTAAWLYDPSTNLWTTAPALQQKRAGHTATRLPGGIVLVIGGEYYTNTRITMDSTELYGRRPSITTTTLPDAITGHPYEFILAATGSGPMQFDVEGLPADMVWDPDLGILQGIASTAGDYTVTVTASNGMQPNARQQFNLHVTPNHAPIAMNDSFRAQAGIPLRLGAPGVLANDTDADRDPVRVVSWGVPQNGGSLSATGSDGRFTYTPAANSNGTDRFTYTIQDVVGSQSTGTVTISVNRAPVAVNDSFVFQTNKTKSGNVLTNDKDPDGQRLTARLVSQPSQGSVSLSSDGRFTYSNPYYNFWGRVSFTYSASDGERETTAVVSLNITPIPDDPLPCYKPTKCGGRLD